MSDDLVKRLLMDWDTDQSILSQAISWDNDRREAADRIEQLTAERDRLREALSGLLADIQDYQRVNSLGGENNHWQVIAHAALKGETP